MKTNLLERTENILGSPSGFSKDRRRVFFKVEKDLDDVTKELMKVENDVKSSFCIVSYDQDTIVAIDI